MDELGFTKIAGAVLATALGVMLIRTLPHMFMHSEYPDTPAYRVGPVEVADAGEAEDLPFPQADWMASMDAVAGAKVFNKCKSCHTVDAGGANGTGPNLYGVVGAKPGAKAGFAYSEAMSNLETPWDYEQLDGFLTKPSKYLKGTKMAYIGLKKPEQRAAVIEYLRLAADAPMAQPTVAAAPTDVAEDITQAPSQEPTIDPTETDGNNIADPATPPAEDGQKPMTEEQLEDMQ